MHVVLILTCHMRFTVQRVVTHIRHNETRDTFANLMNGVWHDVEIEPKFQPLQCESFVNNSTKLKMRHDLTNGLWGSRFNRAFFDVKFFNPHVKTSQKLHKDAYKYHETLKNSKYRQRILNVEQSSFCPLIVGCTVALLQQPRGRCSD